MLVKLAGTSTSMIDGIGISFNIFFQGCWHGCVGCQNPELQPFDGGHYENLENIIMNIDQEFYNSIVLTGGDPVCQLITKDINVLSSIFNSTKLPLVLYTGYTFYELPPDLRALFSVIIDGKYVDTLKTNGFPASSNQRVFINKHLCNSSFGFNNLLIFNNNPPGD